MNDIVDDPLNGVKGIYDHKLTRVLQALKMEFFIELRGLKLHLYIL